MECHHRGFWALLLPPYDDDRSTRYDLRRVQRVGTLAEIGIFELWKFLYATRELYESWLYWGRVTGLCSTVYNTYTSPSRRGEFARRKHTDIKKLKSGEIWEVIQPHVLDHLEWINGNLEEVGRPTVEVKASGESEKEEMVVKCWWKKPGRRYPAIRAVRAVKEWEVAAF